MDSKMILAKMARWCSITATVCAAVILIRSLIAFNMAGIVLSASVLTICVKILLPMSAQEIDKLHQ